MSAEILVPSVIGHACLAAHAEEGYSCDRVRGHGGRHHAGYPIEGWTGPWKIVAVWGEDVHADARQRGRDRINERAAERLFDVIAHLEAGMAPDAAWSEVERRRGVDALSEGLEIPGEPTC